MRSKERSLAQDEMNAYVFTPSLIHLVPPSICTHFSAIDRAKLLLRLFRGYHVYYQTKGQELVSYCFLKQDYLRKYAFLPKDGVLINPYYVVPAYRGRGLGGKLLRMAIADTETDWKAVWAVVKADNAASIRTLEKLGFQKVGYSRKQGWSHKLTQQQTHLPVYCLVRSEGDGPGL